MKKILLFFSLIFQLSLPLYANKASVLSKPRILVSITPYKYLVEKLAKDYVDIISIVPQGADSHTYEPTVKEASSLRDISIYFYIGEGIEQRLIQTLSLQKNPPLFVDLRDSIELVLPNGKPTNDKKLADSHFFLSVKKMQIQARQISLYLKKILPEKKEAIEKNLLFLEKELRDLQEEIQKILIPFTQKIILISHPALTYFCMDYSIKQIGIETLGNTPSLDKMQGLIKMAKEEKIGKVLLTKGHNEKAGRLLAEKLKIPFVEIEILQEDYKSTMLQIAKKVAI